MAAAPQFKVYNPRGEYIAACKSATDAAAIVRVHGAGAQIRLGHARTMSVFTEGAEEVSAADSIAKVGKLVYARARERARAVIQGLDEAEGSE